MLEVRSAGQTGNPQITPIIQIGLGLRTSESVKSAESADRILILACLAALAVLFLTLRDHEAILTHDSEVKREDT